MIKLKQLYFNIFRPILDGILYIATVVLKPHISKNATFQEMEKTPFFKHSVVKVDIVTLYIILILLVNIG